VGKPSLNAAQPYAVAEGRVFLLVPTYPGCPGTKAVKWLLLLFSVDNLSLQPVPTRPQVNLPQSELAILSNVAFWHIQFLWPSNLIVWVTVKT